MIFSKKWRYYLYSHINKKYEVMFFLVILDYKLLDVFKKKLKKSNSTFFLNLVNNSAVDRFVSKGALDSKNIHGQCFMVTGPMSLCNVILKDERLLKSLCFLVHKQNGFLQDISKLVFLTKQWNFMFMYLISNFFKIFLKSNFYFYFCLRSSLRNIYFK